MADFTFVLQVMRGEIKPGETALWLPPDPVGDDAYRFRRGMFNPRRYMPLDSTDTNKPSASYDWLNAVLPGVGWRKEDGTSKRPSLPTGGAHQTGFNAYICPPPSQECSPNGGVIGPALPAAFGR